MPDFSQRPTPFTEVLAFVLMAIAFAAAVAFGG